ncbi:Snf7 family [Gautieria morchelliformis]|nr:Snf7 family [Gautieria morchelliformis]
MGNKSSHPPMPKITARDHAILDLKLQRDKIRQYQVKIQGVLDREHEVAKACLKAGQKERAIIALRRRKYQESILVKTDSQLETLEGLVTTIEFSLVEASILHGLKQGNAVLAEIQKEMNIESVERLMGETQDAIAYQQEINEMLSTVMTADDEDAVLRELSQLQAEAALPAEEPHVELPDAPEEEPVSQEQPERAPPSQERARVALEA